MSENGKKNDQKKPWLGLIVPEAEWEEGKAMTHGMEKYGKYNFTNGLTVVRLLSAAKRHINQTLRGDDIDPETGDWEVHHLGEARAAIGMAMHMLAHRPDLDDRFKQKSSPSGIITKEMMVGPAVIAVSEDEIVKPNAVGMGVTLCKCGNPVNMYEDCPCGVKGLKPPAQEEDEEV